MEGCHEFEIGASAGFKELQKLVNQRFSIRAEEAGESFEGFERQLLEAVLKLGGEILTAELQRLDVDCEGIIVGGKRYRRRGKKTIGRYDSLFGVLEFLRQTFRERGGHGGRTVCPVEMRVGMVGGRWTPAAAKVGYEFMASAPSGEAARLLKSGGTMTPSASHLDRLAKTMGNAWEAKREVFEEEVRQAEAKSNSLPLAATVAVLLMSADGIMVPMKDAPRTPKAGKKDQGPKGHKEATSGTLSLFDQIGERLHTQYLARVPETKKVTLQHQLTQELKHFVKMYPDAKVQVIADGAEHLWTVFSEIESEIGCQIEHTLDFYHAMEHVSEGLRAYASDHKQASDDIEYWKCMLRDHEEGAVRLLKAFRYRLKKATTPSIREIIQKQIDYIEPRLHMMNYADLKARHRPIGSGVQEAACKSLVAERLKRSGMSWRHQGAQAILTLRAAQRSGRIQHFWDALMPDFRTDFAVDPDTRRLKPRRFAA